MHMWHVLFPELDSEIDSPEAMDKALLWTWWTGSILTFVLIFAWPLLTLPAGIFSKGYW